MMNTGIFASSNAREENASGLPVVPEWPFLEPRVDKKYGPSATEGTVGDALGPLALPFVRSSCQS
jgi:hypothetical protein